MTAFFRPARASRASSAALAAALFFASSCAAQPPAPATNQPITINLPSSSSVPSREALKDSEIALLKERLALTQAKEQEEAIGQLVYRTQLEVAALREFQVHSAVQYKPITGEEVSKFVEASIAKEYPGRKLQIFEWFNKFFGIIPPDADLVKVYQSLLSEQVGGLYDPSSETLFVSKTFDLDSAIGGVILSHEICHALQDQNFDLKAMGIEDSSNSDRQMAASALAEGDATMLMGEHVARHGNPLSLIAMLPQIMTGNQAEFNASPPAIQQSLLFPYLYGMQFFQTLAGRTPSKPNNRVDATESAWRNDVFRDPPLTTEQIIHPEKYLAREMPAEVPQPAATLGGTHWDSAMGEYGVWIGLQTKLGLDRAASAAAGWNGDKFSAAESADGAERSVDWLTRWDSPAEAKEFAEALAECFGGAKGQSKIEYAPGGAVGKGTIRIERSGDAVELHARMKIDAAATTIK